MAVIIMIEASPRAFITSSLCEAYGLCEDHKDGLHKLKDGKFHDGI